MQNVPELEELPDKQRAEIDTLRRIVAALVLRLGGPVVEVTAEALYAVKDLLLGIHSNPDSQTVVLSVRDPIRVSEERR